MCSACAPTKRAVASSHSSAIHLRRVIACIHAPFRICAQTLLGTLLRPPKCCLFGWMPAYFFFAVFFAAFFAGAFLAAFLVAICLFSLFDGLHRVLQHLLQLRKCIVSCGVSVKKKTTMEWKKWQQFFQSRPRLSPLQSQNVMRMKKRYSQSCD